MRFGLSIDLAVAIFIVVLVGIAAALVRLHHLGAW